MPRRARGKKRIAYTAQLNCLRVSDSEEETQEQLIVAEDAASAPEQEPNRERVPTTQFTRTVELAMQVVRLVGFAVWLIVRAVATTFSIHR